MNSFNFEKFIPSFGSEILDELYRETPIIETSFEDFLKLRLNQGAEEDKKMNKKNDILEKAKARRAAEQNN